MLFHHSLSLLTQLTAFTSFPNFAVHIISKALAHSKLFLDVLAIPLVHVSTKTLGMSALIVVHLTPCLIIQEKTVQTFKAKGSASAQATVQPLVLLHRPVSKYANAMIRAVVNMYQVICVILAENRTYYLPLMLTAAYSNRRSRC